MNIEKALTHLKKKIGLNKYATDYDRECINEVIRFVNENISVEKHHLFFKLYVYLYGQLARHYGTRSFDGIPQQELHRVLNQSHDRIIKDFVDIINVLELESAYMDEEGNFRHNKEPYTWDFDFVAQNLQRQAVKALQTF